MGLSLFSLNLCGRQDGGQSQTQGNEPEPFSPPSQDFTRSLHLPLYPQPLMFMSLFLLPQSFLIPPSIKLSSSLFSLERPIFTEILIYWESNMSFNCADILITIDIVPVAAPVIWVDRLWVFCSYFSHKPCLSEWFCRSKDFSRIHITLEQK